MDIPRELEQFVKGVHDANQALVPFAPKLAMAEMQLKMGDFRRTMGLTQETEPTAVTFANTLNEMRDAFYPFSVAGRNLKNEAGTALSGFAGEAGRELRIFADLAEALRRNRDPEGTDAKKTGETIAQTLIQGIGLGFWPEIKGWLEKQLGLLGGPVLPQKPQLGPWEAMMFEQVGPQRAKKLTGHHRVNPAKPNFDKELR